MKDIKDKTIRGLGWSFIDSFSNQGIQLISGIILANLLPPSDFGIVAILTIFTSLSEIFINGGFSQALIQKKSCSDDDYNTIFIYNLGIGIFFYFLIFSFSLSIANFFNEPILKELIEFFGLVLIINCFGMIHRTILTKELNFKLQTKISLASSIISGSISIFLAFNGFGIWSLLWKTMIHNFITTFLLWSLSKWRPKIAFNTKSFLNLFSFGNKLLISGVIDSIYRNIHNLVIGKYFSLTELGYYSKANEFQEIPSAQFTNIIARVIFPAFSNVQDNNIQLKAGFKKIIKSSMLITSILMLGLAACSESLILSLIGAKWEQSIGYLQLLCFLGLLYPLHAFNLDILLIKGRSDLFLKLEIIKKLLMIPVIISGINYGITILILAMIVHSVLCYFINSYWSSRLISYSIYEQLIDIYPAFLIGLLASIGPYLFELYFSFEPIFTLSIQLAIGMILTVSLLEILKIESYLDIKSALRRIIK